MVEGASETIMLDFVEAVHVQLPHKTVDFFMPKVSRQYDLFKPNHIFDYKLKAIRCPVYYLVELLILH
jgi:hypothetical protein